MQKIFDFFFDLGFFASNNEGAALPVEIGLKPIYFYTTTLPPFFVQSIRVNSKRTVAALITVSNMMLILNAHVLMDMS